MLMILIIAVLSVWAFFGIYVIYRRRRSTAAKGADNTSLLQKATGGRSRRTYSEEEVEEHTTAEDLWLIIRGKVYDFTDYIALHPGGEAMLRNAGRDSTTGFSGSQHPARVWDMVSLRKYFFGRLL